MNDRYETNIRLGRCADGHRRSADGECWTCEAEASAEAEWEMFLLDLDATGRYPWPIGPDRDGDDARVRFGAPRASLDVVPF